MSLKKYDAFCKIIELGSLTKAAEELGCTQSAVSHMINSIEDEFGLRLLTRTRSGIRLTTAGESLYPKLLEVTRADRELHEAANAIRGLESGSLRIGTFTSVGVHWLPGMIKTFSHDHPKIEIKLNNGDYHDVEQWMASGECDVCFVALPTKVECRAIPLAKDRLLAVLPKNHRLATRDSVPLSALSDEEFVSLLESSDQDTRRTLESAGIHPNIKYTTKDDYAMLAMVENGLGVAIMPELLLKGRTENVLALPLDPPSERTIAIGLQTDASPAAESFRDHAQKWVEERYGAFVDRQ